jgi:hypothetical protein
VPRPNAERDARIIAAARLGQSHQAIAAEHRVSRARVSQIVAAASPRTPEEAQRQLIAARLRSRWDELEKIVQSPPEMHSAIGRIIIGSDGTPIINASAVTAAIKTQLQIEAQYRAMFGVDLATRPGPVLDERQIIMMAEVRAVQQYRAQQAPLPALPALPSGYQSMSPDEQMRASMDRLRAAKQAQDAAIAQRQAEDEIVDAELVDD